MDSQIDEIKSRLDIVDVLSAYINLRPAGANFKANCPFHNEKTPSFMVSRDKQIWHCFGCGEGGDIFGFVMKMEGVEFPEALRTLAQRAGVELRREDPAISSQLNRLLDVMEAAADFYHQVLLTRKEAEGARDYLRRRGLKPKTIESFKIGFAPDSWDVLLRYLRSKNFFAEDILGAGLAIKKHSGLGYLDRFRKRIMFPINDVSGSPVGFTGRLLPEDEKNQKADGKYMNTPQTLIYSKSRVIFGFDKARQEIRVKDLAVVVEGNMDAISCHEFGMKNVIASSGTAFTDDQIRLLKRYTSNLAIAFDADFAGEAAARRGIDLAMRAGMNVRVIQMPCDSTGKLFAKDPDEALRRDPRVWFSAVEGATSIIEYYFRQTFQKYDVAKPENKKKIAAILLAEISKLESGVERAHWIKELSSRLEVSEAAIYDAFQKIRVSCGSGDGAVISVVLPEKDRFFLIAENILGIGISYPQEFIYLIEYLKPAHIPSSTLALFYTELLLYYNEMGDEIPAFCNFITWIKSKNKPELENIFNRLSLIKDCLYLNKEESFLREEVISGVKELKRHYLNLELKMLEREMHDAEAQNNLIKIQELTCRFNELIRERENV